MSTLSDWLAVRTENFRKAHQHPVNRLLHYVGQPIIALGVLALLVGWPDWPWAVGLIVGGFGLLFSGHFFFERNLPVLFRNPLAPVIAFGLILGGVFRLPGQVRRRIAGGVGKAS